MTPRFTTPSHTQLLAAIAAMGVVVLSSNILVQYAINDWLTWGAITYPFAFLVSELVNRSFGPQQARRVAASSWQWPPRWCWRRRASRWPRARPSSPRSGWT
jgi:uncharacterized PurR-regulated membrane protein YhhQ (DUF165 family)